MSANDEAPPEIASPANENERVLSWLNASLPAAGCERLTFELAMCFGGDVYLPWRSSSSRDGKRQGP